MTSGWSSSVMETVVWSVAPSETPAGSVPKSRRTLSSSSLSPSAAALKVIVFDVSPALKVTLEGTE